MAMNLNEDLGATRGVTTFRVPLDKVIVKSGFNTRYGKPAKDKYNRLKELIRHEGQRVPAEVLVLPDKRVMLVDGHQRLDILRELEKEDPQGRTLLVIPFKDTEAEAIERSITANISPTGVTLMDNVTNWNRLINIIGKPIGDVATMYGVSAASISEGLKLLSLVEKHRDMVHEGTLTRSMALRLVRYPEEQRGQILVEMEKVVQERLSKALEEFGGV